MVTSLSDPSPMPGTPSVHTCTKSSWPLIRPDMYGELQVSSAYDPNAAMLMIAATPRLKSSRRSIRMAFSKPAMLPASGFVQRRVAARELRARLRQTVLVLRTPMTPVAHAADRIHQLEQLQAPQHLRRIEQVAGEHGDHALLQ